MPNLMEIFLTTFKVIEKVHGLLFWIAEQTPSHNHVQTAN